MRRFVDYFELKEKYETIKPFKCVFKTGLNVIVGENGSGKSTMLRLMMGEKQEFFEAKMVKGANMDCRFFDTEMDNPRRNSPDPNAKESYAYSISSLFISHGEAMLPIITHCGTMNDIIILFDEPESGISLLNQKKIMTAFRKAARNNCQIIVATHSYVIINKVKEVFCLDINEWISSKEYLKKVL